MHNGILIEKDSYCGPWMTEIIRCLRGFHEPQEELVFARILERLADSDDNPAIVELGCWWSFYSLWFRQRMSDSRVVGVEPDLEYLSTARRHFALNGETADFVHGGIAMGTSSTLEFLATSDGQMHEVPRYSLPELLDMHELDKVSLLLADIQGAETALIEGAQDVFAHGRVRFLVISTHHHSISDDPLTHQRVLATLKELGAHVIAEHSVGESFSGDGLIAASFDPRDKDFTVAISRNRYSESLFGEMEYELVHALNRAIEAESVASGTVEREKDLAKRVEALEAELREARNGPAVTQPTNRRRMSGRVTRAVRSLWMGRNRDSVALRDPADPPSNAAQRR